MSRRFSRRSWRRARRLLSRRKCVWRGVVTCFERRHCMYWAIEEHGFALSRRAIVASRTQHDIQLPFYCPLSSRNAVAMSTVSTRSRLPAHQLPKRVPTPKAKTWTSAGASCLRHPFPTPPISNATRPIISIYPALTCSTQAKYTNPTAKCRPLQQPSPAYAKASAPPSQEPTKVPSSATAATAGKSRARLSRTTIAS